jgi:hypothetical protein
MIKNEYVVVATLKAAAEACKQTCGEWDVKKYPDGTNEFSCPCAYAVMSIDPRTVLKKPPMTNHSDKPLIPAGNENVAAKIDKARFENAPCYMCGYNGPDYYQPSTHKCAAAYHASPPSYPGIPADLARQIADERREMVEALREASELIWQIAPGYATRSELIVRIDAILAREGDGK